MLARALLVGVVFAVVIQLCLSALRWIVNGNDTWTIGSIYGYSVLAMVLLICGTHAVTKSDGQRAGSFDALFAQNSGAVTALLLCGACNTVASALLPHFAEPTSQEHEQKSRARATLTSVTAISTAAMIGLSAHLAMKA